MKRSVTVQIAGVRYALKTEEDDRWVKAVAAFVDGKIRDVQKHTRTVDTQAVAVLTALQIAEELFNERRAVERAAQEDPREEPVAARRAGARSAPMSAGPGGARSAPSAGRCARAREALGAEQRVSLTVAAVERLLALPAFAASVEGRVVAGYVAVGGELSPAGALAFVRDARRHRRVAARERHAAAPALSRVGGRARGCATGRFGLPEPPETAPEIRAGDAGGR